MDWAAKFSCRDSQVSQLLSVLQNPTKSPTLLSVTGSEATGKTCVTLALLEASRSTTPYYYSFVDCSHYFSTRSLLEDVTEQIWEQANIIGSLNGKKYWHFPDFVILLQETSIDRPIYLVFDNADRLGNRHYFETSLLFNLSRISSWTKKAVTPVFVSRKPLSSYAQGCCCPDEPASDVFFVPYTQVEAITIIKTHHALPGSDKTVLNYLARWVVNICWLRCSDLRELIRITQSLYPVLDHMVGSAIKKESLNDFYAKILPHIQKAYINVYRRDKDTKQRSLNQDALIEQGTISDKRATTTTTTLQEGFDLPYCTKFVLLACYLASVIPASHDVYIFSSSSGKKSELPKKGENTIFSRIFTQQRLSFIFSRIVKGKRSALVGPVNIRFEIASLVAQNFLTPCGGSDGVPKFQFNTYDNLFIQKLAKSAAFDLNNYLAML